MTSTTERDSLSGVDTTTTTARQFINGKLVGSKKESTSTSPTDGSFLGRYADADEEQAREAVAAARTAFAKTDCSRDRPGISCSTASQTRSNDAPMSW